MKVVSNSSILIALSKINQLHLIHSRFPEGIIVPAAVWHEVVQTGRGAIEINLLQKGKTHAAIRFKH